MSAAPAPAADSEAAVVETRRESLSQSRSRSHSHHDARTPLLESTPPPDSGAIDSPSRKSTGSQSTGSSHVDYLKGFMGAQQDKKEVTHNQLNTINGCYVPCLLNIMGIVLFERLGWGVGQQGMGGVLLIFLIAEFQAIMTVLSLSAIVSNGNMRGGGSYFMISRTLGPEFGGSIGILFYAAYCVGAAFYCTGFAEEVVSTWVGEVDDYPWQVRGYATLLLTIVFIVALKGAGWFTKINVPLFAVQFAAIFLALIAMFQRGKFKVTDDYHHFPFSWKRMARHWSTSCGRVRRHSNHPKDIKCFSFQQVFGILFPAATGIMEGANLSGDMKDPSFSIPWGTLAAILTSIITYFWLIVAFAGSFDTGALIADTTVMQDSAYGKVGKYVVVSGILISATSSALGSLFGGSRVMQAIARDKLFPYTDALAYGSSDGDEPRIAVVVTWLIAQLLCLIGSLDTIAPIATAFFCLSYATVNLSAFLLEVSGVPNFRPEFTFYTWHTCLLGLLSNLAVMFYVDYKFGTGALVCEIAVFIYLIYRAPASVWGDVTQSVIFHQVRKYLLKLDSCKMHAKLWRPSLLLFVDNTDLALIDFCNNMKKGGLYVVGTVLVGEFNEQASRVDEIRTRWLEFIDHNRIKAFPKITIAPSVRVGYENLVMLSGLGAMEPNTVVLPLVRLIGSRRGRRGSMMSGLSSSNQPQKSSDKIGGGGIAHNDDEDGIEDEEEKKNGRGIQ